MRTCLNSLNLGLSVRLFDILKTYYNGGTVVNELRRCVMTELYCLGQQNPNIKLNFLPVGPASGINRQAWARASKFP